MFTDVMLDLETLGNKSYSAILSIGAVEFNIETGETGREFYRVIDLKSCLDLGLKINADTFYWWMKKSQSARDAICDKNKENIANVLYGFRMWLKENIQDVQIWGNGARFDIGLLEDAYVACNLEIPWNFRKEMDVRTLVAFAPEIKDNEVFLGTEHHPISDSYHQIRYCTKIYNKLKIK